MHSTNRYRVTAWMVFADFFAALALLAMTLYGVQRQKNIAITSADRSLTQLLCRSLRRELPGYAKTITCDIRNSSISLPEVLLFAYGKAEISHQGKVDAVVRALFSAKEEWKDRKAFLLILRGHADASGNTRANLELSRNRARAMESALAQGGVKAPDFHVAAQGVGDTEPVIDNCPKAGTPRPKSAWSHCRGRVLLDEDALAPNRRTELRFGFFSGSN